MTETDLPVFSDSPIHLTALSLKPSGSSYPDDLVRTTWDSFFLVSQTLLPAGRLGWQLAIRENGEPVLFALTDHACPVPDDDLAWIFRETMAPAGPACPVKERDLVWLFRESQHTAAGSEEAEAVIREQGRIYALRFDDKAVEAFADVVSERGRNSLMDQRADDFLDTLKETGGVFRLLCSGSEADDWSRPVCLLVFPEEISHRTRAVLAGIFPFGQITEVRGGTIPADCFRPLPSFSLEYVLGRILAGLMKAKERRDDPPIIDDFEDDDFYPVPAKPDEAENKDPEKPPKNSDPNSAPLEDLDLTPRSFMCLRRAGIRTVGELRNLSDTQFRKIRPLSVRQWDEIQTKLARFLEFLPPSPESVDYRAGLDELIGLESVKAQVKRIEAYARMKKDMESRGISTLPLALNMAFLGNPGTAKTTVARILAGILYEIGILSSPQPVETGRADLVAKYVGQTADKVKAVFREAGGKLLFIDEAYSLIDYYRSGFGDEAITTIVQEMENRRDGTVVVFAGYPREMEEFIARNPGLSSRIPFTIRFEDYSPEDLAGIVRLEAKRKGFALTDEAVRKAEEICGRAAARPDFGNGRFCRNLVENAILSFASRVYGSGERGTPDAAAPEPVSFVLTAEDFEDPEEGSDKKKRNPIGFCA
ncbi:MAG: AAA family ATPase [Lachnospiraceae bacterium]|nr:AAA family ATPase [Lachnospiraceae bacterium]